MNNRAFMRSAAIILTLLLVFSLLASCVEKPQETPEAEFDGKEQFSPSSGVSKNTEELADRYGEYKENASLAFKSSAVTAEDSFTVSSVEGGVKIDAYVGSDSVVVIPESIGGLAVKSIGGSAFSSEKIRAVYVPDSVTFIEKGAFALSENITTIRLPFLGDGKDITHLGHVFGTDDYSTHPTQVPVGLDMVILGEGVTEIGDNAFAGCKSLSAIILPEAVENIGKFAFYECRDLVYLDLGNGASRIDEYAFGYCTSLYSLSLVGAESIGLGALYGCNSIYSLTLPFVGGSKTENRFIGYVFGANVADHNDEYVPKSLYKVTVEGSGEIPDRAFASCNYIGELILSEGIERIGVRSFYSCRSLIEIALPNSVKAIGDDAFFGCDNLEAADLGGAETIGMQAFYGCRRLLSVNVPDGVSEIKPSTFAFCSSLKTVELNKVKSVGKDAFYACTSLTPVDCSGIAVAEGNDCLVKATAEE